MAALLLSLFACSPTTLDTTGEDDDTDLTAEDTDDGDEPSLEDWASDFGDDWFYGCEGDLELDIDPDGDGDGDGVCEHRDNELEVAFEGEIDAEGELEGELTVFFAYAGETPCELSAQAEGDSLEGDFEGTYSYEYWGTEYEYDFIGTIELERD